MLFDLSITSKQLDELLARVDSPEAKRRALAEIWRDGGPVYWADPAHPGLIAETRNDGSVRYGQFVDGRFVETK